MAEDMNVALSAVTKAHNDCNVLMQFVGSAENNLRKNLMECGTRIDDSSKREFSELYEEYVKIMSDVFERVHKTMETLINIQIILSER